MLISNDQDYPYTHVKSPEHLLYFDMPLLLDLSKNEGRRPRALLYQMKIIAFSIDFSEDMKRVEAKDHKA